MIKTKEKMAKYLMKELKKIQKKWLAYVDANETNETVKEKAYLSLTVFRRDLLIFNSPKSSIKLEKSESIL